MTNEEIVEEFCKKLNSIPDIKTLVTEEHHIELQNCIHHALTTKDAEKADWLRSEIEKLEGIKKTLVDESDTFTDKQIGYNTAIDIIITWRKEELLELDNRK